jgi:hypothetical protein
MSSVVVAAIAFVCASGGAMLGGSLRRVIPESHLGAESQEVIKLGTGLIGTMAALVMGLLIASAASSFDSEDTRFQQLSTDIILLDRALAHYGPAANDARARLHEAVASAVGRLRAADARQSPRFDAREITAAGDALYDSIQKLAPANEAQRSIRAQALKTGAELAKTRLALGQGADSSVPVAFLVVLMLWLFVLHAGFGLLAPRNATVVVVLFLCAISVAGAIFLIMDLGQPFEGLIRISSDPLRDALAQIGN